MRKYALKRLLNILHAGAVAVSMAGCGQSGDTEKEGKVEISMLDFSIPGEGVTKAMRPLLDKYLEEHPNVVLDEESVSNVDLTTKVQTLAVEDELPDMSMVKGQMAQVFAESEKMYAPDDILAEDPQQRDNFKEGVFSNFTTDEKIYAIPLQVTDTCAFYNTDLFAQAGIKEFPKTWDELIDITSDLKPIGVTPIVLGNKKKWNAGFVVMNTLGNRLTGDERHQSIHDNSGAKFTDPRSVASLQALNDLAAVGVFNENVNSIDGVQQRQMYMNDKTTITIDRNWAIANLDENCPDNVEDATEMAAPPMVEGGKGNPEAITGSAGWAIAASSKLSPEKPEVVKGMLKAMTGPEYGTAATEEGALSAVKPGEDMGITETVAVRFDVFAEGRPFIPVYDHQLSPGVIDAMQGGLQELLIDRVTPEELAQRIQTKYENN